MKFNKPVQEVISNGGQSQEFTIAEFERIKELNPAIIKLLKTIYIGDLTPELIENITKLWVEK